MRYYEVHLPDKAKPDIFSNVRQLRNLPDGTMIVHIVTESDGTLVDTQRLPVVGGRVVFNGNKQTPRLMRG